MPGCMGGVKWGVGHEAPNTPAKPNVCGDVDRHTGGVR